MSEVVFSTAEAPFHSEAALRVSGLTIRTPHGVELVRDAHFEVGSRELVVLIGPSGSGKTSIINALCGLIDERSGAWQIEGRLSFGEREVDLSASRSDMCGLVFQGNALFDDLDAGENVKIAADHAPESARGYDPTPIMSLLSDIRPEQAIASCSGGQKQRIAIARTLIAGHPILILDEPNSGLDIVSSRRLAGIIKTICTERSTPVVIAAHHVDDLLPLADKVLLLDTRNRTIRQIPTEMGAIERAMMGLDVEGESALVAAEAGAVGPQADKWRSYAKADHPLRWFARYFAEYFWVLCASPFMLAYLGLGGAILGFVSMWFGFNYHAFGGYLKSILHDETLAGIGFVQTTISVPLIASILVVARNSAVICADLGNRMLSAQLPAMRNLNIPGFRYLIVSILVANTLSLTLLTVAALAMASWSALQTWQIFFPDQPSEFWQENYFRRLVEAGPALYGQLGWVFAKIVLSSLLGSGAAILIGLRPKTSVVSINNAIAKAIVIGVSLTLVSHAFFAILQFWR